MRKIVANLLGLLACAGAAVATVVLTSMLVSERSMWPFLFNTVAILVPVALALSLVSMLPIALLLQARSRFLFRFMAIAGMAVGLVLAAFIGYLNGFVDSTLVAIAGLSSGSGGIGGIAYYLVYRELSPNNSFKPTPLRGAA